VSRQRQLDRLIEGLNEDLARQLGAIIRHTYQAAQVAGTPCEEVRHLLLDGLTEELRRASFLTETIIGLGGEPTTLPEEFDKPRQLRVMLELDMLISRASSRRYLEHARLAEDLNEVALKERLEGMAAVEAAQARELARVLQALFPV
jgi:bacterioferritin (cytochrome b1)